MDSVEKMTQVLHDIASGKLESRTNLKGDDKFSSLGSAIDDLAQSLRDNRDFQARLLSETVHEIRNPLMAIQATAHAMIDGILEPNAQRLQTIDKEIHRMSALVDNLQNNLQKLPNANGNTSSASLERINASELMCEIIDSNEALFAEAGLRLLKCIDPDVMVMANRDLISQAIANLIQNALRYTPSPGAVTVKLHEDEAFALIQIQDTGIGIANEDAKNVFKRFWRAENGKEQNPSGMGIGLAVVEEIATSHGGKASVFSEPGKGSTFSISIPLYKNR